MEEIDQTIARIWTCGNREHMKYKFPGLVPRQYTREELCPILLIPPYSRIAPFNIVKVFGARKMVESRVVGFQNDEKYGLIFRCIQCCDGEWLDLPEDEVIDGMKKFEFNKDLKTLKNEITMAVEKIPTDVDVDNETALNDWLIKEVSSRKSQSVELRECFVDYERAVLVPSYATPMLPSLKSFSTLSMQPLMRLTTLVAGRANSQDSGEY